eukprot:1775587-Pleurochrysis_carterae.AAC.1
MVGSNGMHGAFESRVAAIEANSAFACSTHMLGASRRSRKQHVTSYDMRDVTCTSEHAAA